MSTMVSTIADICGILGFLISIFAAAKVIRLSNRIGDINSQSAIGKKNKQIINTGDQK